MIFHTAKLVSWWYEPMHIKIFNKDELNYRYINVVKDSTDIDTDMYVFLILKPQIKSIIFLLLLFLLISQLIAQHCLLSNLYLKYKVWVTIHLTSVDSCFSIINFKLFKLLRLSFNLPVGSRSWALTSEIQSFETIAII